MSLNKVQIIGNLGLAPKIKAVGDTKVARIKVATTEKWKDKAGNKQEHTEWHNCELWGQQAEFAAKYMDKGTQVYVEGSLKTDEYEKDGVKKYATKIKVSSIQVLSNWKKDGETAQASEHGKQSAAQAYDMPPVDDDLPF